MELADAVPVAAVGTKLAPAPSTQQRLASHSLETRLRVLVRVRVRVFAEEASCENRLLALEGATSGIPNEVLATLLQLHARLS